MDITAEELKVLYEYILTVCGAYDVDVPLKEEEISILAVRAWKDYLYELQTWQVRNQFAQLLGTPASQDLTNKFVFENGNLAQKISDWYASQARVGGKTPWHKDYFTLVEGQQIYDLSTSSSTPYPFGTRRIHKIMWVGTPEMFGPNFTLDAFSASQFTFDGLQGGLTYGNNALMYLGNMFDLELLGQSLRIRNRILKSDFFYNISGDIVELTPGLGGRNANFVPGSKVFYYYFNEDDLTGLNNREQSDMNALIGNPSQVSIDRVAYSQLNNIAKNWIDNYTAALAKYTLGSKYRVTKKIASPGSEYEIEFDYQSLLEEAKEEKKTLIDSLREELSKVDYTKLMQNKSEVFEAASKINSRSPRLWHLG